MKKVVLCWVVLLISTLCPQALVHAGGTNWTDDGNYATGYASADWDGKVIRIATAAQLARLAYHANVEQPSHHFAGYTIYLDADVDMRAYFWIPIGSADHPFKGTFDGQGHTITALLTTTGVSESVKERGFIGYLDGGTVKNLTIAGAWFTDVLGKDVQDKTQARYLGAVAGYSSGTIENCHVKDDVLVYGSEIDKSMAGGVVGYCHGGSIYGCTSAASVKMAYSLGGICGRAYNASIHDCLYYGHSIMEGTKIGWIINDADCDQALTQSLEQALDFKRNYFFYNKNEFSMVAQMDTTSATVSRMLATETFRYTEAEAKYKGDVVQAYDNLTTYDNGILFGGNFYAPTNLFVKWKADDEAFIIEDDADWEVLVNVLQKGDALVGNFEGKTIKLANDINITKMAGTSDHPFGGTFDGQGHVINCNIALDYNTTGQTSVDWVAPFQWIGGATIKNVIVSGTIKGGIHTAGLVGTMHNDGAANLITNCRVSAEIKCDHDGRGNADHGGGIVGHAGARQNTLTVDGCTFDGTLSVSTGDYGRYAGAIIGWADSKANIVVTNCVENGTYVGFDMPAGMNYYHDHENGNQLKTFDCTSNSFSINGLAGADKAYAVTNNTEVLDLYFGERTAGYVQAGLYFYNIENLSNYMFQLDGFDYAKAGTTVTFEATVNAEYAGSYTIGKILVDGSEVTPTAGRYTILTLDKNAVVTVATNSVKWTDEGKYASAYSNIDNSTKTLTITTPAELARLAWEVNSTETASKKIYQGWTIKLANDLDMSEHQWDRIGRSAVYRFLGTFDGQGHTISGLTTDDETVNTMGLFGVNMGTVKNLKLAHSVLKGKKYVGAIVGDNRGTVENCFIGDDVTVLAASEQGGGIVGLSNNQSASGSYAATEARVKGCVSKAVVSGGSNVGGIAGRQTSGSIYDCLYMGNSITSAGTKAAVLGDKAGGEVSNNYYTDASLDGVNSNDVRGYRVTPDTDLELTFPKELGRYDVSGIVNYGTYQNNNTAIEADGVVYAHNSFTFQVECTNEALSISDIKVNGTAPSESLSNEGFYTIDITADATVTATKTEAYVVLRDGEDNSLAISSLVASGEEKSVKLLDRTFTAWYKDWYTICLPFDYDISKHPITPTVGENEAHYTPQVKELSGITFADGTLSLHFQDVTDKMTAGRPYLIRWRYATPVTLNDYIDFVFSNVQFTATSPATVTCHDATDENITVTFVGSFVPQTLAANDKSILYLSKPQPYSPTDDTMLYYPAADITLNSFRAYFKLEGITAGDLTNAIELDFDGEPTAIRPVVSRSAADTWYTLDGRRLQGAPTVKGIYVCNGEKMVVK